MTPGMGGRGGGMTYIPKDASWRKKQYYIRSRGGDLNRFQDNILHEKHSKWSILHYTVAVYNTKSYIIKYCTYTCTFMLWSEPSSQNLNIFYCNCFMLFFWSVVSKVYTKVHWTAKGFEVHLKSSHTNSRLWCFQTCI